MYDRDEIVLESTLRSLMSISVSCLISIALIILSSASQSELYSISDISLRVAYNKIVNIMMLLSDNGVEFPEMV